MNKFKIEKVLAEIEITKKEYLRLKTELQELPDTLPQGTCIGNYWAEGVSGRFLYHSLQNKNAVLPSRTDKDKLTKKLHLGSDINPNYRVGTILIEATRIRQIKEESLNHISKHLTALENLYEKLLMKNNDQETQRLLKEFQRSTSQKGTGF